MPDMRSLVLVDPAAESRKELRDLLLRLDWIHLDRECDDYEQFSRVIDEATPPPDAALVCLDADPLQSLQLIERLTQEFPDLPLMAVSGRPNLLVKAHDLGVKSLIAQPLKLEDLSQKLSKLLGGMLRRGLVIALLGARGGVGCTSLAVNLASTLALDPKHQVALIDLDLIGGDTDVALDLKPEYRLDEFVRNIEKLDPQFMKRAMARHQATGLSLLPRPLHLRDIDLVTDEHVYRIITLLRVNHTHLLLDLSKGWSPIDVVALRLADLVLLVTQLEVSSLRNTALMLEALAQADLSDKVRIVLNRVGAEFAGDVDPRKAEEIFGRPIFWQAPNDARAVLGSWKEGVPLAVHAPRSHFQQSVVELAAALAEQAAPKKPLPTAKPSSLSKLIRLFRGS